METASAGEAKAESKRMPPQMMFFSGAAKPKAKAPTQTPPKQTEAKRVCMTKVASTTAPTKTLFFAGAAKAKQPTPSLPKCTGAAGTKEGKKRQGFSLAAVPQKKVKEAVNYSLSDIQKEPSLLTPPTCVAARLKERPLLMGIDIETNDWESRKGNKGSIGKFGFYNICHPDDFKSRIVQLGWCIWRRESGGMETKERLIRPDDFQISAKAERYHGISHRLAEEEGLPLGAVLEEFLTDLRLIYDGGGIPVCHHMEFDANILKQELLRCGLTERLQEFDRTIRAGCCTMSPEIGRWLKESFGENAGPPSAQNTMKLAAMVSWLLPDERELLAKHHTAGADANLHARLFLKLSSLATASAA